MTSKTPVDNPGYAHTFAEILETAERLNIDCNVPREVVAVALLAVAGETCLANPRLARDKREAVAEVAYIVADEITAPSEVDAEP